MGYIAPVHSAQYNDYGNRVLAKEKKPDPMPVHFDPRIKLSTRLLPFDQYAQGTVKTTRKREVDHKEKKEQIVVPTGKGRYINEYI